MVGMEQRFTVIYADPVFENQDLTWLVMATHLLTKDGIIMVQIDHHMACEVDALLKKTLFYVNDCIYKQEWGGISQRYFPRKHDTIFIYANSLNYKFYPERVLVPKKTLTDGLNPSGRVTKIPCDVFDDLGNFVTTDRERIKDPNTDKNFKWQKPMKLMDRLLFPFTDINDWIMDPFMGTGTTAEWCLRNNRNFYGIEKDTKMFKIAKDRVNHALHNNTNPIILDNNISAETTTENSSVSK
jgi:DNA modification methylase